MADIGVTIRGETETIRRFEALPAGIQERVAAAVEAAGLDVLAAVIENLSGRVLKRRTGRLSQAQNIRRVDQPEHVERGIGFQKATAPYGDIFENTGARPHIIAARNARALRFTAGGRVIFRREVHHPGTEVRPFLRSALRELSPEIIARIEKAVIGAVSP